eukprot:c21647_g1_i1 orf=69-629(+)
MPFGEAFPLSETTGPFSPREISKRNGVPLELCLQTVGKRQSADAVWSKDPLNWVKAAESLQGSHLNEVKHLVNQFLKDEVWIEGANLTIAQVTAVSRRPHSVKIFLDADVAKSRVDECSQWVMHNVMRGTDTYGVTTGFGATSHRRTNQGVALQRELIRFLNAGVFGSSDEDNVLPATATRAAMLV